MMASSSCGGLRDRTNVPVSSIPRIKLQAMIKKPQTTQLNTIDGKIHAQRAGTTANPEVMAAAVHDILILSAAAGPIATAPHEAMALQQTVIGLPLRSHIFKNFLQCFLK